MFFDFGINDCLSRSLIEGFEAVDGGACLTRTSCENLQVAQLSWRAQFASFEACLMRTSLKTVFEDYFIKSTMKIFLSETKILTVENPWRETCATIMRIDSLCEEYCFLVTYVIIS